MWRPRAASRFLLAALLAPAAAAAAQLRGTGDLGIIIERAAGRAVLVETTTRTSLGRFEGLGDLSHASAVFSRDGRYAYVFGRDGGLSRLDLLEVKVAGRALQAGNSIGGAISQDGRLVAVSNYEPGGVRVFDSETLAPVADIPAVYGDGGKRSRVVGLVDAPGQRFVFSLFDAGEVWIADLHDAKSPSIRRVKSIGKEPYDGLITPDTRHYVAGLFGEDGITVVDLWSPEPVARRVLEGYGRGAEALPVYKMPHLEGWAAAGEYLFVPGVGHHYVLAVDRRTWQEVARIPVRGQPVFTIARPDGRQVWVNFALPDNGVVQVIDVASLKVVKDLAPGKAVLHMEFTPRGDEVWISARDDNKVVVLDTESFAKLAEVAANQPSGIFLTARANRIGM